MLNIIKAIMGHASTKMAKMPTLHQFILHVYIVVCLIMY
uniref:Uncharacterized protein n=1 Tax=Lepeophtheirus salmonis TaxID=72036 RepID=A0A0K2VG70_LEPSM